ncbi:hypothetical protein AGABI1DRAFT_107328 [Agaricus bisporus var. burnettii JB137-S8]|uniref:Uncharacterized protein n=1 Tax=Agaricus bisporus var. burnettii (strain JB137-S8 / ATCC MYA-4627 / FGSC 10392) TaxID=597362 RepID=K5XUT0_AGABU|nr:uncharacterized protein AGABI1DRAFT_107328 [Agaricus bisporus var. burnettii JB137-S8]EKM78870.1 hypothetical protein AGABI1DRAFT_107328 [Agaricus bisporus var. burnettii JB137-S8]
MATSSRTDPLLSVSASNEARISDLCDVTAIFEKELTQEPATEQERSKGAVPEYQKQWHEQEKLMRTECESLLLFVVNYTECLNVLNERHVLRAEKLLYLGGPSDCNILCSRANWTWNWKKIKENGCRELALIVGEVRSRGTRIENLYLKELIMMLRYTRIRPAITNTNPTPKKGVNKLREENFEGSRSSWHQDLESQNDELKRRNHDLQRQLDKWQRLEGKGETELEPLRKQKLEQAAEAKTYLTCIGFQWDNPYHWTRRRGIDTH